MRYTYIRKQVPGSNPIANVLVMIAGALVIGVSIVLGFFAFVALSALILISAAIIGVRVWWLKRKLRGQPQTGTAASAAKTNGDVIEGEFRVLPDDRDET